MKKKEYKRNLTIRYAQKWAYDRNSKYYNFDDLGGDCTNFISQCVYAGSKEMNYSKNNGWYYSSLNNRSASWSGVNEFYNFLVSNKLNGPRGEIVEQKNLNLGDIIQLSFNGNEFAHTLIIVDIEIIETLEKIYTASHTFDSYKRKVSSYNFKKIRFIHINGVYKF